MMHRVGLTLATLSLGTLGACSFGGGSAPSSDPAPLPSPNASGSNAMSIPAETFRLDGTTVSVPLILEVSGDANADITYTPERGQPPIRVSTTTPWSKTLQISSSDLALLPTLTARTSSTSANATITCRIKIAGTVVEAKTARGPHALANCSVLSEVTQTP